MTKNKRLLLLLVGHILYIKCAVCSIFEHITGIFADTECDRCRCFMDREMEVESSVNKLHLILFVQFLSYNTEK